MKQGFWFWAHAWVSIIGEWSYSTCSNRLTLPSPFSDTLIEPSPRRMNRYRRFLCPANPANHRFDTITQNIGERQKFISVQVQNFTSKSSTLVSTDTFENLEAANQMSQCTARRRLAQIDESKLHQESKTGAAFEGRVRGVSSVRSTLILAQEWCSRSRCKMYTGNMSGSLEERFGGPGPRTSTHWSYLGVPTWFQVFSGGYRDGPVYPSTSTILR